MEEKINEVILARANMNAKRLEAEKSAGNYRKKIKELVDMLKPQGYSVRAIAKLIGITEGALRDLLRPDGQPRRSRRKKINEKLD